MKRHKRPLWVWALAGLFSALGTLMLAVDRPIPGLVLFAMAFLITW